MAERKIITPSEVLLVIRGGPPKNLDPEASRRGIQAHQLVRQRIETGNPPKCLDGICQRFPKFEQRFRREIGPDGLVLSATPDVVTKSAVVEIKPSPIRREHLLQAVIECDAVGKENAVVYGYRNGGKGEGEMVVIRGVGNDLREKVEGVCRRARGILDLQAEIEQGRKERPKTGGLVRTAGQKHRGDPIGFACEVETIRRGENAQVKGLGWRIVNETKEFDKQVGQVLEELQRRAKK